MVWWLAGDTLGNTTLTVHEKAWTNVSQTAVLKGLFEVDSTIGRDLTFRVEITKSKKAAEDCSSELLIKLAAPDQTRTNITYKCSQKDFGIYSHPIPEELNSISAYINQCLVFLQKSCFLSCKVGVS